MSNPLTPQQKWAKRNPEKILGYAKKARDKRRAKNPHASRDEYREYRSRHPIKYMLANARQRAKQAGVPFTIEAADLVMPSHCPVFPEIKLEFAEGNKRPDNIPTLDRVIPSKGYVKGNVNVISFRANRLKSDANLQELKKLVNYMEQNNG